MKSNQDFCPKCNGEVFAEHEANKKWIIRCCHCNYQTDEHDSLEKAQVAWKKMIGIKMILEREVAL